MFIVEDKNDPIGALAGIIEAIKKLNQVPPIRIYLVADGEHAWELAAGLGISGVLKRHYSLTDNDTTTRI